MKTIRLAAMTDLISSVVESDDVELDELIVEAPVDELIKVHFDILDDQVPEIDEKEVAKASRSERELKALAEKEAAGAASNSKGTRPRQAVKPGRKRIPGQ